MVAYLLTRPHFIHRPGADSPVLVEGGTTIEWGDAEPSLGMAAIDEEGEKRCKERDERVKKARAEAVQSGRVSPILADQLPKAEPAPPLPDEEVEEHRGRRPRR